jgi:hypothetical protein
MGNKHTKLTSEHKARNQTTRSDIAQNVRQYGNMDMGAAGTANDAETEDKCIETESKPSGPASMPYHSAHVNVSVINNFLTRHRSLLTSSSTRSGKKRSIRTSASAANIATGTFYPDTMDIEPTETHSRLSIRCEDELDRIDYKYNLLRRIIGDSYITPINEPKNVLDIGTGTGFWLMDLASRWPSSQFTGVDIVPHFPSLVKPKNCRFIQLDLLNGKILNSNELNTY